MSNFSLYASFNESNVYDLNIQESISNTRTFEQLITERGESFIENPHVNVDYNKVLDKIKSKLFDKVTNSVNLLDCPLIKKYTEDIVSFKKDVCDIYLEYTKADNELTNARGKYAIFCENIKNCIDSILETREGDETDVRLRDLLEAKVESYYNTLNIDQLIENYTKKNQEFEKIKYKISLITQTFLPTTICQICLENQVDYFIDPCGHTICKLCKEMCENKSLKCHYCRTPRKSYKRIYL